MGLAHLVGGSARSVGSPTTVEPELRRDGIGLLLIAAAILVAAAEWWELPGQFGDGVRLLGEGAIGVFAWALPVLLIGAAWSTLRRPDREGQGRTATGWLALSVALLGLIHISRGLPRPGADNDALRSAGGGIGYVVSSVLVQLVSIYVAVPLLVLLLIFGLVVVLAAPLHSLPGRITALRAEIDAHRRTAADAPEVSTGDGPAPKKARRRRGDGLRRGTAERSALRHTRDPGCRRRARAAPPPTSAC